MIKLYKIMFFNTLVIGTMIAISSYSWLSMWMGLEINLLSIIPLMSNPNNIYPSESALKYFLTQALASSTLLFSIISTMNMNEFLPQNSNYLLMMVMNSALLTKMGAAPFHAWFPEVMEGLDWMTCLIMLTWQKIAPMILLLYNLSMTTFISTVIIFSSLIGGIMGLNQISLRKIMAYSSINHIGWMIASMINSTMIWLVYFLIYCLVTANIVLMFWKMNLFSIKQMILMMNKNKTLKLLFMMNFLSLGGLPPFLGFFPKWLTINNLAMSNFHILSLILIVMTLITLFFYLRLTFSSMTINSTENLTYLGTQKMSLIIFLNFISLSGLMACTFIFNTY